MDGWIVPMWRISNFDKNVLTLQKWQGWKAQMWQSTHAPFWPIHAQTSQYKTSQRHRACSSSSQGGFLLCFSGVCQLNSWCHQTPGPTATLNESLRNGQLCSGQETPLKNLRISSPPLAHFPFSRHASTATSVRPDHLPHNAAVSLPSPRLPPSPSTKLWTWTAGQTPGLQSPENIICI